MTLMDPVGAMGLLLLIVVVSMRSGMNKTIACLPLGASGTLGQLLDCSP